MPNKSLSAPQSRYRTANYHRRVVSPGRGLVCSQSILKGQAIAAFKGTVIDHQAFTAMSATRSQYVLRLYDESDPPDAPYYQMYLDCYERGCVEPPECLASMANSADGLYDRRHDFNLHEDDNNADTVILDSPSDSRKIGVRTRGGLPSLVLYAQQYIAAGDEIMWDYDGIEILDDPPEGGGSQPTAGEQHFQRVISDITRYSTAMEQAPAYAITTHSAVQPPPPTESTPQPRLVGRGASSASSVDRGALKDRLDDVHANDYAPASPHDAVLMATSNPFDPRYIIWDCASGSNICKNPDLATNVRPCKPAAVMGIVQGSEGVYSESCNFLDPALGRCPLAAGAIANIVSQSVALEAGFRVRYTHADRFVVTHPTDRTIRYEFGRVLGARGLTKHYLMDTRTLLPPTPSQDTTYTLMGDCVGVDSVEQRAMKYTKNQISDADKAMEFIRCMGHPTPTQCFDMLERMLNPPTTKADVKRAIDIYGPSLAAIRGRTTKTTTTKEHEAEPLKTEVVMEQIAEVDLMFVRKEIFLMCLLTPLEFSFTVAMDSKSIPHVRNALESVISASKARGFTITTLRIDNEPAVASANITNMLASHNILVDTVAAGDHVSKAERRIRFIKEKWRVLVHTLAYVPSKILVRWGVIAANRLVNMQRSSTSLAPESPREKFLGRLTDYKRDVAGIAFGSYVQAPVPNPNNSDAPRTEACIALVPKDNQTGTFFVLKLKTNKPVARSHLKPMPITDHLRAYLDREALKDGYSIKDLETDEDEVEADENEEEELQQQEGRGVHHYQSFNIESRSIVPSTNTTVHDASENDQSVTTRVERVEHQRDTVSDSIPTDINHDLSYETAYPTDPDDTVYQETASKTVTWGPSPTKGKSPPKRGSKVVKIPAAGVKRSARIAHNEDNPYWTHSGKGEGPYDIPEPEEEGDPPEYNDVLVSTVEYVFATEVLVSTVEYVFATVAGNMSCEAAIGKHGSVAQKSIEEEMFQFIDRGAFDPVRWTDLSFEQRKRVIPSMMFLKEKHTPEGTFERLKARLVARGDKQDRELYKEDVSASTSSSMSQFSVIAIAAHERRKAVVSDIPGAFLHAPMKEGAEEVFLRIEPVLANMLVNKYPDIFKQYLHKDRKDLVVKLLRAVYGTIEAARLWLDDLTAELNKHGYVANPFDPCVFNKIDDQGNQCTICLYVDDLLITCVCQETIDEILGHLNVRYGGVKTSSGKVLHYLGMILDFTNDGYAKVTMDGMIEAIMSDHLGEDHRVTPTPCTESLFSITDASPLLTERARVTFHTAVAKMLYVSKRVRPDCLTTVGFLVTRVTKATEEDQDKLQRLLRYVSQSHTANHKGIILHIGDEGVDARGWIDAAHGVHDDYKSVTGCAVGIGQHALVHYHSSKQPIIAKSSTEAELIAVSDSANQAIHLRSFLIAQGYPERPAILYQDNMSAIALIKKGKSGSMRTRHICIRYYWLHEQCEIGTTMIVYKPTGDMGAANILTKAVVGGQFIVERQAITNWNTSYFE